MTRVLGATEQRVRIYGTFTDTSTYTSTTFKVRNARTMHTVQTHPAFTASMQDLQNMWRARFGSDWVRSDVAEQEEFFDLAARRLLSAGRLESHHLTAPNAVVYKLVE